MVNLPSLLWYGTRYSILRFVKWYLLVPLLNNLCAFIKSRRVVTLIFNVMNRLKMPDSLSPDNQKHGDSNPDIPASCSVTTDYFVIKDGVEHSGTHLLIDFWGASRLDDVAYMQQVLECCVSACEVTLLHIHLHQFSDSGGVSGVAVLAESHISVHTWPERAYAAFDVFMCGQAKPLNALAVLEQAFKPSEQTVKEILRGHHPSA